MKIFNINRNIQIVCRSEKTSYGFRHLAELVVKDNVVCGAKCCYYNRTWECYEFESVLEKNVLLHVSQRVVRQPERAAESHPPPDFRAGIHQHCAKH